ncbi:MAG: hypothetical protein KDB82_14015 [Planctomycetes bacterium]|nr:hypothetical protein [Planctomycetota bacterium]
MRAMTRTMCALVILLLVFTAAGAQEEGGLKAREDGNGIDLKGTNEEVTLGEIIHLYVEETGNTVLFDPRKIAGDVTINSPEKGVGMGAEELLNSALKQYRLVLASDGNVMEIIPAAEAVTQCETVTREQLKDLPPGRFVRIVVQLRASDANAVRGALQNLTTRQGGVVNPVAGANSLIIADYAHNMGDLLDLVDRMEAGTEVVSRVYKLEHVKYVDIQDALNSCLDPAQARRAGSPAATTIGATANGKFLVISGVIWEVDRIETVLKQLDVPQDE